MVGGAQRQVVVGFDVVDRRERHLPVNSRFFGWSGGKDAHSELLAHIRAGSLLVPANCPTEDQPETGLTV